MPGKKRDKTPPSVPAGLRVTGTTVSAIDLAWNTATDNVAVTGYGVFRNGARIAVVGILTYRDMGLAADHEYAYRVTARDAAGNESAQSPEVRGRTLPLVPLGDMAFEDGVDMLMEDSAVMAYE